MSKIIRECFGFASLHSVISPRKNSRHHLLQSAVNFVTWLPAFSRVLGSLLSFTLVAVISLDLVLRLSVEKRPLVLCKCNGLESHRVKARAGIFLLKALEKWNSNSCIRFNDSVVKAKRITALRKMSYRFQN